MRPLPDSLLAFHRLFPDDDACAGLADGHAMARRLRLSLVQPRQGMSAARQGPHLRVRPLPAPDLGDHRDDHARQQAGADRPGQDEMGGGLADDTDVVAVCGNSGVARPAVGFHCGVGVDGGFDEVAEVGGAVGGDFGQPQAAGRVRSPNSMAPTISILPSWLRPRAGGGDRSWCEREAGLVDFDQTRQRIALRLERIT